MLKLNVTTEEIVVNPYGKRGLTYTFAPCGENHVGNQVVGKEGCVDTFSMEELRVIQATATNSGVVADLIDLGQYLPSQYGTYDAGVLVLRNALNIFHLTSEELFEEVTNLKYDTQFFDTRRKKVLNKLARHNIIVGDFDQKPVYEEGKGTVVSFTRTPCLNHIRTYLPTLLGEKASGLIAEANDYYDVDKCGIGYHGDAERTMVVGLRIGAKFPLSYYWYHRSQRISQRIDLDLNSGDLYIMSEKAVGKDWKKSSLVTLRHSAGVKYVYK
uniref:2OG-Fe(II) oxygenase superfamily protein n=1 Tax=Marseillevirus LCMAC102 TaxID=2506603 RepID=A0A481YVX7_9VIRU|nr:MAG: uncharacterized protein LCMAC102_04530 [Marseillevirus LCMAC102]